MTITRTIIFFLLLCTIGLSAQQKSISAHKVEESIEVDGVLDEAVWGEAPFATNFTQIEPDPGLAATEKTEIKILYSNKGLYVGARMYDRDAENILREYSKRDQLGNADNLFIMIDPYQSGIYGFGFGVSVVGVQLDMRINNDYEDYSWDAVWSSSTTSDENGWTAELYIPYSALRFSDAMEQNWNIQFVREIRRHREKVTWNPTDPDIDGILTHAGTYSGLYEIESPTRLALYPYVAGYIDNFERLENYNFSYSAGLDLKYGLSDAFTLDMALIPDFGQVISDDLVLNLTPFETYFDENRPFFTEGLEFFDKGNLFYSRRVGSTPYYFGEVVRNDEYSIKSIPSISRLYNATKLSGRLSSGTGFGFFNGIARDEYATVTVRSTGEEKEILVNPITNYNVSVVDQNLKNNSSISLINTNTWRAGDAGDANVTGLFFDLKNKNQKYGIDGNAIISHVTDNIDPTGFSYNLEGGKIGGKYRATAYYGVMSAAYDINDLGYFTRNNLKNMGFVASYVQNRPSNPNINKIIFDLYGSIDRLHKPNSWITSAFELNAFMLFRNRIGTRYELTVKPSGEHDYFEPRTGGFERYYAIPASVSAFAYISTDYRKILAVDAEARMTQFDSKGRQNIYFTVGPRVRVSDKFTIIAEVDVKYRLNDVGFTSKRRGLELPDEVRDSDILFSTRRRQIVENSIRLSYIINSKMHLDMRARHYWDKANYSSIGTLQDDGSINTFRQINTGDSYARILDYSSNFFQVDFNYKWRFAPGSDLILNWKNNITQVFPANDDPYFTVLGDLLRIPDRNSFSLKIIYYLDYNRFVKS